MIKGLSTILALGLLGLTYWLQSPTNPLANPLAKPALAPLLPSEVPTNNVGVQPPTPSNPENDPLFQQLKAMYQENLHRSPSDILQQMPSEQPIPSSQTIQAHSSRLDQLTEDEWLAVECMLKGARLLANSANSPMTEDADPSSNVSKMQRNQQLAKQLRAQVAAYLEQ
jgi:hypothetical protein